MSKCLQHVDKKNFDAIYFVAGFFGSGFSDPLQEKEAQEKLLQEDGIIATSFFSAKNEWHFHQAREKAIDAFAKAGKHVKQVDLIKFVFFGSVFWHCLTCLNHSPALIFLTHWNGAGQKSHT